MDQIDLSRTVLQISAFEENSIKALNNSHNQGFIVSDKLSERPSLSRHQREETPSVEPRTVLAVLRTDHYPFDPLLGWVFGSDEETCDVLIGTRDQGVSRKHFRIDHNWRTMTLVLTNISTHGTHMIDPETGDSHRITTSRAIFGTEQHRITLGAVNLTLRIPSRNQAQQAGYSLSIQRLGQEVVQATPSIRGLNIQSTGAVTPAVVGRKRKFVLRGVIGNGAMATVYKAIDAETGDLFAAKEYDFGDKLEARLRSMRNEVKILQKLKHVSSLFFPTKISTLTLSQKHIVEYIEIFKDPHPIIIMELAAKSLADCKPTEHGDCTTILKHIFAGLAYLHGEKIIHRDVKPGNILLTNWNPPEWKLTDFGLSKIAEVTTTFCGSPLYLAPEVGMLEYSAYTTAIDVWAVGVVGVEYTCGFAAGSTRYLKNVTKRDTWCSAVVQQSKCSELAALLGVILQVAPSKRPSANDMVCKLELCGPVGESETQAVESRVQQ